MSAVITNEYGDIIIDKDVVAKIANRSAMECYGLVGMAYFKNGFAELLNKNRGSKGINVEIEDNRISLELSVIIEYGTRVSTVAENIMDRVKYDTEMMTGLEVEHISIKVAGVRVEK